MRLAIVHQNLRLYGGGERFTELVSRELGCDVVSVAPDEALLAQHPDLAARLVDASRNATERAWFLDMLRDHVSFEHAYDFLLYSGDIPVFRAFADRTPFLHYCHTPPRFMWGGDLRKAEMAKHEGGERVRWLLYVTALWLGSQALHRVVVPCEAVAANSRLVADRYQRLYGKRPARVIHPPIDFPRYATGPFEDGFLTVSRLEPAKRVDWLIRACARADERLTIVGDGPDRARLARVAEESRADVEFAGRVGDAKLADLYARCRAFLFAAQGEDFGLVPFEALASGKPLVAIAEGGFWEAVDDRVAWSFRTEDELASLLPKVTLAACRAREAGCRAVAKRLDAPRVADELRRAIGALRRNPPWRGARAWDVGPGARGGAPEPPALPPVPRAPARPRGGPP